MLSAIATVLIYAGVGTIVLDILVSILAGLQAIAEESRNGIFGAFIVVLWAGLASRPMAIVLAIGLDVLALGLLAHFGGLLFLLIGIALNIGYLYWRHRAD